MVDVGQNVFPFVPSRRQAQILILEILNVFRRLKFPPFLTWQKIEHFSKVSMCIKVYPLDISDLRRSLCAVIIITKSIKIIASTKRTDRWIAIFVFKPRGNTSNPINQKLKYSHKKLSHSKHECKSSVETFEKCSFLFKFKEGENFNHRHILSISRIKIWAWRRNWAKRGVLQRSQVVVQLNRIQTKKPGTNIMIPGYLRNFSAASYSPTQPPKQYHRRKRA